MFLCILALLFICVEKSVAVMGFFVRRKEKIRKNVAEAVFNLCFYVKAKKKNM